MTHIQSIFKRPFLQEFTTPSLDFCTYSANGQFLGLKRSCRYLERRRPLLARFILDAIAAKIAKTDVVSALFPLLL